MSVVLLAIIWIRHSNILYKLHSLHHTKALMTLPADIHTLKQQLDDLRPFDQAQFLNLRQWFRIGFVHHSNALE